MTKRASSASSAGASGSNFKRGKVQKGKNNNIKSIVDAGGQRFRFKNFNDRIEDIDISSIQRIGGYRGPGPQSTDSTWFELSFEAWQELNCTTPFALFCYAIRPLMGTLPRLLFNRDRIVKEIFSLLKSAAASPDSPARLALIPVLSLTAMLAKDLGSDFLIFFPEFFSLLTEILPQSSDTELIEAAFASLLYVFKCLLPHLVSDLAGTFKSMSSTAANQNQKTSGTSTAHLKRFSAQCFGYLLRKSVNISSNSSDFIKMITSDDEEFLSESLFSAIFDESTGRFRTCLKPLYLEIFTATSENECWGNVLRFLSVKLLDATDLNTNGPLWKIIIQLLNSDEEQSQNSHSLDILRRVLIDSFAYRRGTRVQHHDQLLPGVMKIGSLELTAYFMRSMNLEITLQNRAQVMKLIETVLDGDFSKLTTLSKFLVKINWLHYDLVLSGIVIKFIKTQVENDALLVELLTVLLPHYSNAAMSLLQSVPHLLTRLASNSVAGVELLISHFPQNIPSNFILQYKNEFENILLNFSSSSEQVDIEKLRLCTEILTNSNSTEESESQEISGDVLLKFIDKYLRNNSNSAFIVLKSVEVAIKVFKIKFSSSNLEALIYKHLLPTLHFASSEWRIESLNLLEILLLTQPEAEVVQVLKEIEEIPEDLQNYREKLLKLKKLEHLPLMKKTANTSEATESNSSNLQQLLVLHYLLGFLQVKLSLLSAEGNRILSVYAKAFSVDFAAILTKLFNEFSSESSNVPCIDAVKTKPDSSGTVSKSSSYSYEIEIDDEFLNRLERIRVEVASEDTKAVGTPEDTSNSTVATSSIITLLPVILKAFSLYPEIFLKENGFREQIFISMIISTFSSSNQQTAPTEITKILQSNLICVFKTISGCRVDLERERDIEAILLKFLSHGDLTLQNCALDALFSMKRFGAALSNQWKGRLKSLLNDNLFREELTNLTSEAAALPSVTHWSTLLVPLIVRILFGRFISRRGAAAGRHSLPLRRKMIMNCFGTWNTASLAQIVDFLLENLKDSTDTAKQIGFLNTLENVLSSLARNLDDSSMDRLISALVTVFESTETEEGVDEIDDLIVDEDEVDDQLVLEDIEMEEDSKIVEDESMEALEETKDTEETEYSEETMVQIKPTSTITATATTTSPMKRIRQLVMKRLLQLFKLFDSSSFTRLRPFLPTLFAKVFNPRVERLSSEFVNADKSSALMEIFVCWANTGSVEELNEIFTVFSPELWNNLISCFANPRTKPLILDQILTVFEGLILRGKHASESVILMSNVVLPHLNNLLDSLDYRLKTFSKNYKFVFRVLSLIQSLTPHVTSSELALRLTVTFEGLLKIRTINEPARTNLILSLIPLITLTSQISDSLYEVLSSQWNVLTGRPSRVALYKLFAALPQIQPERPYLQTLAESLENLNAWQAGRVSEPDFDRRLTAFAQLRRFIESNENNWKNESEMVQFFTPLLHEMIHGLKDIEELSIRNQSFGVLKSIIKVLQSEDSVMSVSVSIDESESDSDIENEDSVHEDMEVDNEEEDTLVETTIVAPVKSSNPNNSPFFKLIHKILLPSIKFGLKSSFEPIRIEFVSLLDLLISSFPTNVPFSALHTLIKTNRGSTGRVGVEDIDEEFNIFRNIYHIQEPRRTWAIRQIGELASEGKLQGLTRSIVENLLLPLVLGTALPNPNSETPFEVSEAMQKDSIVTAGCLLAQLPWRPFLSKLIHYVREISSNKRSQEWSRAVLRLLPSMISQFVAPVDSAEISEFQKRVNESVLPAMFRLLHKSETTTPDADNKKLAKTASGGPMIEKISVKHSLRVPIAIAIGQLIRVVSQGSLDSLVVVNHLPKLLNALLNVLKLKDADTRDVARGALVKILSIFGTAFLPFFLKEAKILLNKGYQRHVLTFTSHAILLELLRKHKQSDEGSWNLDPCAGLLIDMALASSFGCQAAERAAIEWSGKQPEVRAAKGPEIIALTVQFTSQPLLKDVVFSRIFKIASLELDDTTAFNTRGTGATDEKAQRIESVEGDTFDELLRSFFTNGLHPLLSREPERLPYLLEMMHQVLSVPGDSGSKSHIHRLQARAFEFISFVLTSSSLIEANDLGKIVPFIALTREYILEKGKHVDAMTAAITLFNQFISFKSLHPVITDLQPLLQKLFTIILKGSSQSIQISAAYRLTSTLIRDWSELEVNDTQIKALIEYTRLQLDNPHQQALTFSLVKSLISRQIVLLQLFELMETIRTKMITSHHPTTRQQCRSAFVHFLLNYPMATKKLEEQLDFLLTNIRYEFATGRESVIEVMGGLMSRLPMEVIESISEAWFVGFAVQLSKETSSTDGSSVVIDSILSSSTILFNRLPAGKRRDNLETLLLRWITQSPKLAVQGAAWKLAIPLIPQLSNNLKAELLEKAVDMIDDADIPVDLLQIIIKFVQDLVDLNDFKLDEQLFNRLLEVTSQSRFFTSDCDLQTRNAVALLWNTILKQTK